MGALSDAIAKKKQDDEIMASTMAEQAILADPTRNMSTMERFKAGMGQGASNTARQTGNMIGLVSDEDIEAAKEKDKYLLDTVAGQVGSFVGETAALAPLMLLGGPVAAGAKGIQLLNRARGGRKAIKALGTVLPRAKGAGNLGMATAATEGAAAGAILSGPDNRTSGALTGGLTGGALNRTIGAVSRKFAAGVDKKPAAERLTSEIRRLTGESLTVPVAQGAANKSSAFVHRSGLSMFPLARGGSNKMATEMQKGWEKAILAQTFGKKNAQRVMDKMDDTDSFSEAALWGLDNLKGGYSMNRRALADVVRSMSKGDMLSPRKLDTVAGKLGSGQSRPFYDLTSSYLDVMGRSLEESTVAGRRLYNKAQNNGSLAAGGAASGFNLLNYAALTGGTALAASKPAQKFVMGDSVINKAMRGVGRIGSPYAAAVRNQIAGGEQ